MNADFEKTIGQNIRKLRLEDDLSTKLQLHNCDITRSALAKIEVGQRHIYVDELCALKEILHVSYEIILTPHSYDE